MVRPWVCVVIGAAVADGKDSLRRPAGFICNGARPVSHRGVVRDSSGGVTLLCGTAAASAGLLCQGNRQRPWQPGLCESSTEPPRKCI